MVYHFQREKKREWMAREDCSTEKGPWAIGLGTTVSLIFSSKEALLACPVKVFSIHRIRIIMTSLSIVRSEVPCVIVALNWNVGFQMKHCLGLVFQITTCRCWFVSMNVWGNLPPALAASHQSKTFFLYIMTTYSLPTIEVKCGSSGKSFKGVSVHHGQYVVIM